MQTTGEFPSLSGEVENDEATLEKYSKDASLFKIKPQTVVFPKGAEDLKKLVEYASNNPGTSLTPRSGGTDMSGAAVTDSVIVDMTRHFNKIGEVTAQEATAEPGVFYRDFEPETLKHNALMPSYPASRELCTLGGIVANNSGGEKTLSYGKTTDYVAELKVVLADGNEYDIKPLTRDELDQKMAQQDFEGKLYRDIWELISQNQDLIQSAKPNVSKNSSGYALWNVWDEEKGVFDLTQLMAGAQGTLGIITKIKFKLIQPKPHKRMLVIFMKDIKVLADVVGTVLKFKPETFESYDDHTLKLALKFLPGLIKQMGVKNLLQLGLSFIPESRLLLTGGLPRLVLLAEFTGDDPKEVAERAKEARAALKGQSVRTRIAKTEAEVQKYWTIRRESFSLLRKRVKEKRTAPFIDDICVRPEVLPQFLPALNDIMDDYDLTFTVAGHIGDGNFHIIPLVDPKRPDLKQIIDELSGRVFSLTFSMHGSMSGEHNDGLIRSHFLADMFGPDMVRLFEETKDIFDPKNIFNPKKKAHTEWAWAKRHLVDE